MRLSSNNNIFFRHFVSGGSEAAGIKKVVPKTMALTQWKLFNQLKAYMRYPDKTMYQTVNKEFAKLLQKMQPTIYGDHLIRQMETKKDEKDEPKGEEKCEKKLVVQEPKPAEASYNMPKVLSGLKLKIGKTETVESKPKWMCRSSAINRKVIMEKTIQLISLIPFAKTDEARINSIENLSKHLIAWPDEKHQAVKVWILIFIIVKN